jgi:ribosomal protein L20
MIEPKVLSIQELHERAENMQTFLEEKFDSSDANILITRSETLQRMMAESGKCLADAKWYKDKIVNGAIMDALKKSYEEKLSASTINKYVDTCAKEYTFIVNWLDRINASATHQNDSLRTFISYRKSEMTL